MSSHVPDKRSSESARPFRSKDLPVRVHIMVLVVGFDWFKWCVAPGHDESIANGGILASVASRIVLLVLELMLSMRASNKLL